MTDQRQYTIVLRGGLDLVTPHMEKRPGSLIGCSNYEAEVRGYRRVMGYERRDGRPKPSEAAYWLLSYTTGTVAIAENDVVTGASSGATGIALRAATVTSGSVGGGDAAGDLYLYNVTGTFTDGENLEVSASPVAVLDGDPLLNGAASDTLSEALQQEAIEKRRAVIAAVPGSGPIRGVLAYKGELFAFRDNVGATACIMHKESTAGWAAQSFGHTLDFTAGTAAFLEGETVTGGTSGATATIRRVVLQSGAWSGTAAGFLVLSGITGTFSAAETITSASGSATCSGAQAAITLPAGGVYRGVEHNFYGTSNLKRLYFVNGESRAHEWDGTVLAPVKTGAAVGVDKPTHVAVHSNHLLLGFRGGAIMYSSTGEPLQFIAATGAGEFGFGGDITGLISETKTATIVTGRNKVGYFTGNDDADFQLQILAEDSGAFADTLQVIGQPHFLDDQGVRSMEAAQSFGDWTFGTVTRLIEPLIRSKREQGVSPVGSVRVRARDQYRLFYADGTGVSIYFGREQPECTAFALDFTPTCVTSTEDATGSEMLLAGADDGFIYQLDSGTSADGAQITALARLSFLHQGAPRLVKRYHRAVVDLESGRPSTTLLYAVDFGYGDADVPSAEEQSVNVPGSGGFWDISNWEDFYWDSPVQSEALAELNGIGPNVSMTFLSDATYEEPHTLASLTINFSQRRVVR